MLYILDTDTLSLLQRSHPLLQKRIATIPPPQLAITIVTAEEQLRGRLAQVNKTSAGVARIEAYQHLRKAITDLGKLNVLAYDTAADATFLTLKRHFPRIGSQDLRIAAIALTQSATLVSRNQVDFGQLPNLSLVDWTR